MRIDPIDQIGASVLGTVMLVTLAGYLMGATDLEALPVGMIFLLLVIASRLTGIHPYADGVAVVTGSIAYFILERGQGTLGAESWAVATASMVAVGVGARFIGRAVRNIRARQVLFTQTVEDLTVYDDVSGLYKAKYGERTLDEEVRRARRLKVSLTLIVAAPDELEEDLVNDALDLDEEAALVGAIFREVLRVTDRAVRLGPTLFAAILPDTGATGGAVVAEKLLRRSEAQGTRPLRLAVVTFPETAVSAVDLQAEAAAALELARAAGLSLVTPQMLG